VGDDLLKFNHANVLRQLEAAEFKNGYYTLSFYALPNGKPSSEVTSEVSTFYLYPSGGTLRDAHFQLVFYDSRYDTYRGFKPPDVRRGMSPADGNK
jgi:hypothetical protein